MKCPVNQNEFDSTVGATPFLHVFVTHLCFAFLARDFCEISYLQT